MFSVQYLVVDIEMFRGSISIQLLELKCVMPKHVSQQAYFFRSKYKLMFSYVTRNRVLFLLLQFPESIEILKVALILLARKIRLPYSSYNLKTGLNIKRTVLNEANV